MYTLALAQDPTRTATRSQRGWAMVEARLGQAPFLGGRNLTTADIMMVYCLTTSRAFRGLSIDGYPNLKAYLARYSLAVVCG